MTSFVFQYKLFPGCKKAGKQQLQAIYMYVEKKIVFVLFELHGGLSEDGKAVSTNMW